MEDVWIERPAAELTPSSIYHLVDLISKPEYRCHDRVKEIFRKRANIELIISSARTGFTSTSFLDMYQPGIDILLEAYEKKTPIFIWGDYDVDGITSTAILATGLKIAGWKEVNNNKQPERVLSYDLASRFDHGYGMDINAIRSQCPPGTLIITVDNGITENETVEALKQAGYQVLITDHHLPNETLPDTTIVNPKVNLTEQDDEYMVPGVYVAAKLVYHFLDQLGDKLNESLITKNFCTYCSVMVTFGIISDTIPLNPILHRLVREGLIQMQTITHDGIQALFSICGMRYNQPVDEHFLAFSVLPKLNASGRMGKATISLELLMNEQDNSIDKVDTLMKANKLKYINTDRKLMENFIVAKAAEMAEHLLQEPETKSLVLWDNEWHHGVSGIVAARIADRFRVPTIIFSADPKNPNIFNGSGRTVYDYNIYNAVDSCKDVLLSYGGHAAALGVKCEKHQLEAFRTKFNRYIQHHLLPEHPVYHFDTTIDIQDSQDILFHLAITNLAPFGNGNPELNLRILNLKLVYPILKNNSAGIVFEDKEHRTIKVSKYPIPKEWEDPAFWQNMYNYYWDILVTPIFTYYTGTFGVDWKLVSMKPKMIH